MMKCRQKLLAAGLILCIAVTGCAGQDKAGDAVTPSSGAVSQTEGQERPCRRKRGADPKSHGGSVGYSGF